MSDVVGGVGLSPINGQNTGNVQDKAKHGVEATGTSNKREAGGSVDEIKRQQMRQIKNL